MYGNNYQKNPEATRLFPYILSKFEPQIFSFRKSKFSIEKEKDGTSRISLWKTLKIPAVYTLETSLCGGSINGTMPHFTTENLGRLGEKLCSTILLYQQINPFVNTKIDEVTL